MRRVVVTGLGAVTPLGLGIKKSWNRLLDGHCGIVSLHEKPGYSEHLKHQQCHVGGLVPQDELDSSSWLSTQWLTQDERRHTSEFMKYAIYAAKEALDDGGWHPETPEDQEMTGVVLGSGIGNLHTIYETSIAFHQGGAKKVSPLFIPKLLINLAAGHISMKYNLKGPSLSPTTACTTGTHSIGSAYHFLQSPTTSLILAGASESSMHPLTFTGFERTRSLNILSNLTPQQSSRPFNKTRSGFILSEGAAVLLLEELSHALSRNAPIYAELVGYGASSDAHHMTAPPPDGDGAFRAMRTALREAGVRPKDVDYINAHATGTVRGDRAENRAIKRLMLGGDAGRETAAEVNVSSTKGAVGHLLGAAGALEAAFTVLAIKGGVMPPTLNLSAALGGGGGGEGEFDCNYVPGEKQEGDVKVAVTNSFGFGGTNASLCFRRFEG